MPKSSSPVCAKVQVGRRCYRSDSARLRKRLVELEESTARLGLARNHLAAALDAATEMAIITTDASGIVTVFNEGAARLLGRPQQAVVERMSILEFFDGEELRERLKELRLPAVHPLAAITSAALTHGPEQREWTFVHATGKAIPVTVTVTAIPGGTSDESGFLVIAKDLTEKRRMEREVLESRELLSSIVESIPNPIFYKDIEGRYIDCNAAFCHFLGLPKERIVGATAYDIAPMELADIYHAADLELMKKRDVQVYESRVQQAGGDHRDVVFYKSVITDSVGTVRGLVGVILDISNQKQAEAALRASEEQLRLVFEASQVGIFLVSPGGTIIKVNPRMHELFRGDVTGRNYLDLVASTQLSAGAENMSRLLRGDIEDVYLERLYLQTDGGTFWGLLSGRRLSNPDGTLAGLVGMIADVTERKKGQDAVEAEKERLMVTLKSIGDGVITVDTSGRIVLMNHVAESLTGWTLPEAEGRPLSVVFPIANETGTPESNPVDQVLRTGRTVEMANHSVLVSRNGEEHFIEDSAAPIKDNSGAIIGVVLVFRDVSEKKQVREELFRIGKLQSLGVLAGGIAHDFNNLLTGITANLSVAAMLLPQEHEAMDRLARAQKGVQRAADLTQQLLTFSKGGAPVRRLTSLKNILMESAGFALRGSNVRCEFNIADDLWQVEADPGQMSQVIHNLVINADQAMPGGGTITVSAGNTFETRDGDKPVRHLRIAVKDCGEGITEENLQRIFDPYFTTKAGGSGLGLATVHSIIRNHGGDIRVMSRPGKGTEFAITLPAWGSAPEPAEQAAPLQYGSGRILLMDDEEDIREVGQAALQFLGYEPVCCTDGESALVLYREALEQCNPFSVVIMDLTIPGGIGGLEAAATISRMDPAACMVVSSGYSNDPIAADYREHGFSGILLKPYTIDDLGEALAAALARKPPVADGCPAS